MEKILIIGGGLMGASLGKALNKVGFTELNLLVKNEEHVQALKAVGLKSHCDYNECSFADIIFLASPLGSFDEIINKLNKIDLKKNIIISDLGSVKSFVSDLFAKNLNNIEQSQIVPTHPIAGSHLSGAGSIIDDLYVNKKIIFTGEKNSNSEIIANLWLKIGGNVEFLDSSTHDLIYAYLSHLPQKIAYLFFDNVLGADLNCLENLKNKINDDNFNDFTRLCTSNKKMWGDIFKYNDKYVKIALDNFSKTLNINLKDLEFSDNLTNCTLNSAIILSKTIRDTCEEFEKESGINLKEYLGTGYKSITSLSNQECSKHSSIHSRLSNFF
jgi:prephenate dehydrogenase